MTALHDAGGDPVNTRDVVVGDDGNGNAVLSFPGGESLTLHGIDPAAASNEFFLQAMGIPMSDGTVTGTAGDDLIQPGFILKNPNAEQSCGCGSSFTTKPMDDCSTCGGCS